MTTELLEERSGILDLELPMTRLIEHTASIQSTVTALTEGPEPLTLAEVWYPARSGGGVKRHIGDTALSVNYVWSLL